MAYSKASLLRSLEGLSQEELVWQPGPGKNCIGWHAMHVGQFQGALIWNFEKEPHWEAIGPFLPFGYGSDADEARGAVPEKGEMIRLIHADWDAFVKRFRMFREEDFGAEVPLNNPDGETLFEMLHRVSWHADHHVGKICGLRSLLNKPMFPRPTFGGKARRKLVVKSESGWERILGVVDE